MADDGSGEEAASEDESRADEEVPEGISLEPKKTRDGTTIAVVQPWEGVACIFRVASCDEINTVHAHLTLKRAPGPPVRFFGVKRSLALAPALSDENRKRVLAQIRLDSGCCAVASHLAFEMVNALASVDDDAVAMTMAQKKNQGKGIAECALCAVTGVLLARTKGEMQSALTHEVITAIQAPGTLSVVRQVGEV